MTQEPIRYLDQGLNNIDFALLFKQRQRNLDKLKNQHQKYNNKSKMMKIELKRNSEVEDQPSIKANETEPHSNINEDDN